MSGELYASFVAATVILMLMPGPNVALITTASVTRGARLGLLTVVGTLAAMPLQLLVVALGMAEILRAAGAWFTILRWVGAGYLVWLGVMAWRAAPDRPEETAPTPRSAVVARGFLISLTNPKTLLFYAAFFPQFIAGSDPGRQIWVLAITFVLIAAVIDSGWALAAASLRPRLTRWGRWTGRASGSVLIAAGAGLAAARAGH